MSMSISMSGWFCPVVAVTAVRCAVFALLLALGEVVGASLVLAGGHYRGHYSRIGAILLIVIGFVIMFTVHLGGWTLTIGKSHVGSSMEFMMILFLIALYVGLKDNKV